MGIASCTVKTNDIPLTISGDGRILVFGDGVRDYRETET